MVSQGNQRFLYQTSQPAAGTGATVTDDDDGLGPLPDGEQATTLFIVTATPFSEIVGGLVVLTNKKNLKI